MLAAFTYALFEPVLVSGVKSRSKAFCPNDFNVQFRWSAGRVSSVLSKVPSLAPSCPKAGTRTRAHDEESVLRILC
jgi:hypothetical protein